MVHQLFRRTALTLGLWTLLVFSGGLHCGSNTSNLTIEITAPSNNVTVGDTLQLTVTARDGSGNVVTGLSFTFDVNIPNYAMVDSTALVTGMYPGNVEITASADGATSAPFALSVDPLSNSQTVTQITDNAGQENDWGPNNVWKMISGRNILFLNFDGANNTVRVYNLDDPIGTFTDLNTTIQDTDFLAMGSGATAGEYMASFRLNLDETLLSNNGMGGLSNLGSQNQEENSIDEGCFFFREGGGFNDIQLFQFGSGLMEIASTNELRDPIGSQCHAVWSERPGGGTATLIFYDGSSQTPVVTGLDLFPDFYFSLGQVVYVQNDDVFHVDTSTSPFTTTQVTNDGSTFVDQSVRTDGNSIAWIQEDPGTNEWRVYLYEIATGTTTLISPTTNEKVLLSLNINLKQVTWFDSLPEALFFYPGAGDASSTINVPQGGNNIETTFDPFIEWGALTWVTGALGVDTEIQVMQ